MPISNELFVFALWAHAEFGRVVSNSEVMQEVTLGPNAVTGKVQVKVQCLHSFRDDTSLLTAQTMMMMISNRIPKGL